MRVGDRGASTLLRYAGKDPPSVRRHARGLAADEDHRLLQERSLHRGRITEQLAAISGALTLLANVVMAWNTHRLQAVIDEAPNDHPDEVLSRLAPIGHKHINMRGILTFELAQYGSSLLRHAPIINGDRVSK